MKKSLLILAIATSVLAGCAAQSTKESRITRIYNNHDATPFSLTLPADFSVRDRVILPAKKNGFPAIYYSFSKETPETELLSFTQKESDFQAAQCKEKPEMCAKVSEGELTQINGNEALNYNVQYVSVNPEKEGEHMNNYHTSFKQGENFVHFWTYAGDKENPEEIKKKFDQIIKTISFEVKPPKTTSDNKITETADFNFDDFGPNWTNDGEVITVSKDEQNLEIHYGGTSEVATAENLLQKEKDWNQVKCGQTDVCGEMKEEETLKVKQMYDAAKFTLEYKGRSLDDQEGSISEFHYSVLSPEGNLYRFWTSATDQENPNEKEALFDSFMQTISFNQTT